MEYEDFKGQLCAELADFYGEDAQVGIRRVEGNNGQGYDGLEIVLGGMGGLAPVINTGKLYEEYHAGTMDMWGCIEAAYQMAEAFECPEGMRQLAEEIKDWDSVREDVYPILLHTGQNRKMLQDMVSMPFMDLSIAYTVSREMPGYGDCRVRISRVLLGGYGISSMELHRQAMENMGKGGYHFQDIAGIIGDLMGIGKEGMHLPGQFPGTEMYVLTNRIKKYGAAGILDKKLVKDFAGGRDFFILPSSVNEVIFVPVSGSVGRDSLDRMVREINEAEVPIEERLSDHAYYYDAQADEIRM
ncbi:MAG: DUF5688 family protein [Lachnospiraceae bacterium]|nr:DUF5688 family protein [Lachnospiraceae bacterium]